MGAEDIDTEQLSLIKQMLVEKIGTLKGLDSEMAELVPGVELEDENSLQMSIWRGFTEF